MSETWQPSLWVHDEHRRVHAVPGIVVALGCLLCESEIERELVGCRMTRGGEHKVIYPSSSTSMGGVALGEWQLCTLVGQRGSIERELVFNVM